MEDLSITLNIPKTKINEAIFVDDSHIAILFENRNFLIWNVASDSEVYKKTFGEEGSGNSMAFDHKNKIVILSICE